MCLIVSGFTGKSKQVWRARHTQNINSLEKQSKGHINVLARTKEFHLTSLKVKGEIYWLFISNKRTIYSGKQWSRTCFPNNNVICKKKKKCTHPWIMRSFSLISSVYNLREKTFLAEEFLGLKLVKPVLKQRTYPWQFIVKQSNVAVRTSPVYLPPLPPGVFLGLMYCSKDVHHQNYPTLPPCRH